MSYQQVLIPHISTSIDAQYVNDLCRLSSVDSYNNTKIQEYIESYRNTKNPRYRDKILLCYGKVVLTTAKKYQNNNVNLADLLSEGFIAVTNAIDSYDYTKGVKFITYTTWVIERHLRDVLDTYNLPVYVPKYVRNNIKTVYKYNCEAEVRGINLEDIIKEHIASGDISTKRGNELSEFKNGVISYQTISFDKGSDFYSTLDSEGSPTNSNEEEQQHEISKDSAFVISTDFDIDLVRILEVLEEKERMVLVHNLGLFNTQQKSLNELSIMLGITTERIRQLKERAVNKIKKSAGVLLLAKYL